MEESRESERNLRPVKGALTYSRPEFLTISSRKRPPGKRKLTTEKQKYTSKINALDVHSLFLTNR